VGQETIWHASGQTTRTTSSSQMKHNIRYGRLRGVKKSAIYILILSISMVILLMMSW
jgi:hypothetical protein